MSLTRMTITLLLVRVMSVGLARAFPHHSELSLEEENLYEQVFIQWVKEYKNINGVVQDHDDDHDCKCRRGDNDSSEDDVQLQDHDNDHDYECECEGKDDVELQQDFTESEKAYYNKEYEQDKSDDFILLSRLFIFFLGK